jgi:hypothetical protein
MAASYNLPSDLPAVVTNKVEPPLLLLPLELHQRIYGLIFGPRRLIDLSDVHFELDPWSRHIIYGEKLKDDLFSAFGATSGPDY